MLPEKVLQLTIPLFPLLHPDEQQPCQLRRIRPVGALDLRNLVKKLEPSTITTLLVGEKPWSVVSVFSPYTPDVHVMVVETSTDRYLPGPESVPDEEGNELMSHLASILDFLAGRESVATIHVGYNWSPRAWGEEEEKTGFQSVPTKWHVMVWGCPPFPNEGELLECAEWVETASLPAAEKRLLGDNDFVEPFAQLIRCELEKVFPRSALVFELFDPMRWRIDGRGICMPFNQSLPGILRVEGFFSQVLKPVAVLLDQITRGLTKAMTTLDVEHIDEILAKTEEGQLSEQDLRILRATPALRSLADIRRAFEERGYPESLLEVILEPVRNRCNETGDRSSWWRKGFGYALVLSGSSKGGLRELRIMPGVLVGPGGVVEAQGIVLRRPEDRQISHKVARERSRVLWQLARVLHD